MEKKYLMWMNEKGKRIDEGVIQIETGQVAEFENTALLTINQLFALL